LEKLFSQKRELDQLHGKLEFQIIQPWNSNMEIISINEDFHTNFQKNSQIESITILENLILLEIEIIVMFQLQENIVNINLFHGIFISI